MSDFPALDSWVSQPAESKAEPVKSSFSALDSWEPNAPAAKAEEGPSFLSQLAQPFVDIGRGAVAANDFAARAIRHPKDTLIEHPGATFREGMRGINSNIPFANSAVELAGGPPAESPEDAKLAPGAQAFGNVAGLPVGAMVAGAGGKLLGAADRLLGEKALEFATRPTGVTEKIAKKVAERAIHGAVGTVVGSAIGGPVGGWIGAGIGAAATPFVHDAISAVGEKTAGALAARYLRQQSGKEALEMLAQLESKAPGSARAVGAEGAADSAATMDKLKAGPVEGGSGRKVVGNADLSSLFNVDIDPRASNKTGLAPFKPAGQTLPTMVPEGAFKSGPLLDEISGEPVTETNAKVLASNHGTVGQGTAVIPKASMLPEEPYVKTAIDALKNGSSLSDAVKSAEARPSLREAVIKDAKAFSAEPYSTEPAYRGYVSADEASTARPRVLYPNDKGVELASSGRLSAERWRAASETPDDVSTPSGSVERLTSEQEKQFHSMRYGAGEENRRLRSAFPDMGGETRARALSDLAQKTPNRVVDGKKEFLLYRGDTANSSDHLFTDISNWTPNRAAAEKFASHQHAGGKLHSEWIPETQIKAVPRFWGAKGSDLTEHEVWVKASRSRPTVQTMADPSADRFTEALMGGGDVSEPLGAPGGGSPPEIDIARQMQDTLDTIEKLRAAKTAGKLTDEMVAHARASGVSDALMRKIIGKR